MRNTVTDHSATSLNAIEGCSDLKLDPANALLGRMGSLEVRLVASRWELREAQRLRYHVFYEEMSAPSSRSAAKERRDVDHFDAFCDHLIVLDHDAETGKGKRNRQLAKARVVGTYRLLRQEKAFEAGGFYSQAEYDVNSLIARHPDRHFLELGRSCVLPAYRTKRTVELLWHGIWAYVLRHRIDVMFGVASLEGTEQHAVREQLRFLASVKSAPDNWRVRAQPERHMPLINDEMAVCQTDSRRLLATLPPLIKGYLRLGAFIGDGAVIDYDFGTTDIFILLPVENIEERYIAHYGDDAGRHAA